MTQITFDKFEYVERLKSGGIPHEQAKVHAEALDMAMHDGLETRTTLKQEMQSVETTLQQEIRDVETTLRQEIQNVETTLRQEIQDVRTELKADIQRLKDNDIAPMKRDIAVMKFMMGIILAAVVYPIIKDIVQP